MHARKLVIEAIQVMAANVTWRYRLSYPVLEEVRHDHHEVNALSIDRIGGLGTRVVNLGVGITPVLAWLDAKRKMGLSRG